MSDTLPVPREAAAYAYAVLQQDFQTHAAEAQRDQATLKAFDQAAEPNAPAQKPRPK